MDSPILLLPFVASLCLLMALVQAWLMTCVRYFNAKSIRRLFPNYRDLVRSHVDYLIMAGIVFGVYATLSQLTIDVPTTAYVLVAIGAFYNPFGFLLQAIKPDIVDGGGWLAKLGLVVGFMPLSIGLAWISVQIATVSLTSLLN